MANAGPVEIHPPLLYLIKRLKLSEVFEFLVPTYNHVVTHYRLVGSPDNDCNLNVENFLDQPDF